MACFITAFDIQKEDLTAAVPELNTEKAVIIKKPINIDDLVYHLLNDPSQFEKMRYIDSINTYNSIIEDCQKQYDKTSQTDRAVRVRCLKGIKLAQRELAKTQAEYNKFKEYKARTAISR
jgi:hypothetical protein